MTSGSSPYRLRHRELVLATVATLVCIAGVAVAATNPVGGTPGSGYSTNQERTVEGDGSR
jgi:hypothetical protein